MIAYKKQSRGSGRFISDPGFWIQDSTTTKKREEWGGGALVVLPFFVAINITKLKIIFKSRYKKIKPKKL
jgi:hypothetical protein